MSSSKRRAGSVPTDAAAAPASTEADHINNMLSAIPVLRATYLAAAKTLGHMCLAEKDDDSAFNTHDFAVAFNRVLDTGRALNNANAQLITAYALAQKRKQEGFQQLLTPVPDPTAMQL
jgi:hypothetical protein